MADLIYLIEDDESIRELVKMVLETFGFQVAYFETAEEALEASLERLPSLYIFDIMLPGMDGISAVKKLRGDPRTTEVPVMMLTAKDTEFDTVTGLDAGADDYLAKPFGVMELAARVRALLRRYKPAEEEVLRAEDLSLNPLTRECIKAGEPVQLTFKEFELLYLLMKERDRVVTRDEIIASVWGEEFLGETRTLDMHIRSLRQKLGDDAENPKYIRTVRGVGYRFVST
ncbi:MAG: response regulator transcription factor [Bacillota bacterium]|nr:response regulator transcription factor [Bacillota bacterium]NLU53812.1 response regulator transcription factor [Bacillota bacterium]HOA91525.1 response regulator transcription factor [Bacillota bacterium]HOL14105.1 response regulator transcription factor [Bacillota bacterium]HOP54110.1 response regulator transcription factor [Bacillota bacterium]